MVGEDESQRADPSANTDESTRPQNVPPHLVGSSGIQFSDDPYQLVSPAQVNWVGSAPPTAPVPPALMLRWSPVRFTKRRLWRGGACYC